MSKKNGGGIAQRIVKRLKDFANSLTRPDCNGLPELMYVSNEYKIEYQKPSNWEIPKMSREMYLQECRDENARIREEYGPILITYIRKIPSMILPGRKFTNEELLKVVCLNRALNRAINGDGNLSYYNEECPPLVSDYLANLEVRANKYFCKYDK